MKARDYLWCALHLALDREEELARLCPACRRDRTPPLMRRGSNG